MENEEQKMANGKKGSSIWMRLRFCSVYIAAILKIAKRSPCSGGLQGVGDEPSQGGAVKGWIAARVASAAAGM